jgi:hypothetical protein
VLSPEIEDRDEVEATTGRKKKMVILKKGFPGNYHYLVVMIMNPASMPCQLFVIICYGGAHFAICGSVHHQVK